MRRKRYRIGTALKRTYSKAKQNVTKKAKTSATVRAIKKTSRRIKNRFITMIKKTASSIKRATRKADKSVAKKIRSLANRRRR